MKMSAQLDEPAVDIYCNRKTVIVTGFGPFKKHELNASWESVKLLKEIGLENELGIELVIEEIPVVYCAVEEKVPELWKKHNPMLVMHVGVSSIATCLNIEKCAKRTGYFKCDEDKAEPSCGNGCLCSLNTEETRDTINTSIDVPTLCSAVNMLNSEVQTLVSEDAGRYICEYTYYASLSIDNTRTIFVHVPTMDIYAKEKICQGLSDIIRHIVNQFRKEF